METIKIIEMVFDHLSVPAQVGLIIFIGIYLINNRKNNPDQCKKNIEYLKERFERNEKEIERLRTRVDKLFDQRTNED